MAMYDVEQFGGCLCVALTYIFCTVVHLVCMYYVGQARRSRCRSKFKVKSRKTFVFRLRVKEKLGKHIDGALRAEMATVLKSRREMETVNQ